MTGNTLEYAWDTVSISRSAEICAAALTDSTRLKPMYGTILPLDCPRQDVQTTLTVMYTVFGRHFKFGPQDMPASKEDYEFGLEFFKLAETMVSQVELHMQAHPDEAKTDDGSGAFATSSTQCQGRRSGRHYQRSRRSGTGSNQSREACVYYFAGRPLLSDPKRPINYNLTIRYNDKHPMPLVKLEDNK